MKKVEGRSEETIQATMEGRDVDHVRPELFEAMLGIQFHRFGFTIKVRQAIS